MKRFALILLAALALCSLAMASDGYAYNATDGLYYYPGYSQGYTRYLVTTPGYWTSYGCYGSSYVPGSSYYRYSAYTAPATPALSYQTPNWQVKLLEIAAARDQQVSFERSVAALGLTGNFRFENYGAAQGGYSGGATANYRGAMPYALSGNYSEQVNFGANANTAYGLSYNSLVQPYGDETQLYQQAAQLAQQSLKLGGDATNGFQLLVGANGQAKSKVAEIVARGQQAAMILQALQAAPSSETRGLSFRVEPATGKVAVDNSGMEPTVKADVRKQFEAFLGQSCAQCHSGKNVKGKLDLTDWPNFTAEQKQAVWSRITTTDESRRMPRDLKDETRPGPRLTPQEQRLFLLN